MPLASDITVAFLGRPKELIAAISGIRTASFAKSLRRRGGRRREGAHNRPVRTETGHSPVRTYPAAARGRNDPKSSLARNLLKSAPDRL
jgi:hypothetical protein